MSTTETTTETSMRAEDSSGVLVPTDSPSLKVARGIDFHSDPFVDDDSWAQPPRAADRRLKFAAVALGLALVSIGGFAAGAKVQKSRASTTGAGAGGAAGFGGRGAGGAGFPAGAFPGGGTFGGGRNRPTTGTVSKVDGNVITLTKADGTEVTVTLSSDASIGRRTTEAATAIVAGERISVTGATAEDGSIAATGATVGDLEVTVAPGTGTGSGTDNSAATPTTPADLGGLLPK